MPKIKTLGDNGVVYEDEGVDEVQEVIVPSKTPPEQSKPIQSPIVFHSQDQSSAFSAPEPKTQEEKKRQWNEYFNPSGHKLISKKTYIFLWIAVSLLLITLATSVIWSNLNFAKKEFGTNLNISVAPAQVTTPINNNISIINNQPDVNVALQLNLTGDLAQEIGKIVNDTITQRFCTNSSNSTFC